MLNPTKRLATGIIVAIFAVGLARAEESNLWDYIDFLASGSTCGSSETITEFDDLEYKDDKDNPEYCYNKDGKRQGGWTEFSIYTLTTESGTYVDGKRNGLWVRYWRHSGGYGHYFNGKQHGQWKWHWQYESDTMETWEHGKCVSGDCDDG